MFSGIHSLIFGKKHKHRSEDSGDDRSHSADNDFVILERRHSGDFDKTSSLYPNLDPSNPGSSNLPYVVSPSLPNLNDDSNSAAKKEDTKVDMLQSVPFVLSPEILLLDDSKNKSVASIQASLNDLKELGEENFFENFSYDFELEHSVSLEYS
ncbi:hypothetical protein RUM43_014184 [Polyplax serrata]|uniref:UMA domain-containing protein n=1 Tax=Polyplax serrata TaxID=468196 RepID=A0AAN8PQX0_POLSC